MTELDDDARVALRRGLAHDGPSAERRARVKQRLVIALGSGAVSLGAAASAVAEASAPLTAASTAAGTAMGGASLAAWFGAGLLGGALVAGAMAIAGAHPPAPSPAGPRVNAPPSAARLAPSSPTPSSQARASLDEPPPGVSGPRQVRAAPTRSSAEPAGSEEPGIGEEALLLQRAQRALAASDANRALGLLGEHERRFPTGQLREERQVATVLALCSLGRLDAARTLARDFRERSPHSVLIPRLDRSCASGD